MNKELTPLQALKNIKNAFTTIDICDEHGNPFVGYQPELKAIEAELIDAEKYKKALEIIKKKQCIHILALKQSANWRAYNEFILPLNRYNGIKLFDKLTQKEYKILKEVLK